MSRTWSSALLLVPLAAGCGSGGTETGEAPPSLTPSAPQSAAVDPLLQRTCGASRPGAAEATPPTTPADVASLELALTRGPDPALLARVAAVARRRHAAWLRLLDDPDSGLDEEEREVLRATSVGDVIREAQIQFALGYRTRAIQALGAAATPAARVALTRVAASSNPRLRHAAELALVAPLPAPHE